MKKAFIIKILFPLLAFSTYATARNSKDSAAVQSDGKGPVQNISFSGKVVDEKARTPLGGATVHIEGTTHEVVTKNDGKFNFLTGQRFPVTVNHKLCWLPSKTNCHQQRHSC